MTDSEKIQQLEARLTVLEKSKRHRFWLWLGAAIVLPATLYAATAIPNTFSEGETLSAAKMNANFTALAEADVPTGTVVAFAGQTAPDGWLLCDGSLTSRTTRAKLFAAIGTAFGAGDGSTTFHLPDFRGRFLRGVNSSTGRDPDAASRTAMNSGGNTGDTVGSVQADVYKNHRHALHAVNAISVNALLHAGAQGIFGANNVPYGFVYDDSAGSLVSYEGGNETRPVNAYVNWIIKH